ncbi:MAG TPA: hypothetical protein VIC55_01005 [Gemmatimonadaceae bacterium]
MTARVGDKDVWFESGDVSLAARVEAFISSFLVPALAHGDSLTACAPVAAGFAAGLRGIVDIASRWWGYPQLLPCLDTCAVDPAPQRARRTALCFSGGADSFQTLLVSRRQIDDLVFVHGFDIPLHDTARAAACEAATREVASLTGARAIVLRTNLRRHAAFRSAPWERTHGGALAAVGHLLTNHIDTLLISASYPYAKWRPWGSHWALDPLWSGHGLTIEHVGAEFDRMAKLRALRDAPLARRHLRVCWENRTASLNCSRCEKCIRTQVILSSLGALDEFTVFEPSRTLVERIDAVPRIHDPIIFQRYGAALSVGVAPDIAAAVRRLIARSRRALWHERLTRTRERAGAVARRLLRVAQG